MSKQAPTAFSDTFAMPTLNQKKYKIDTARKGGLYKTRVDRDLTAGAGIRNHDAPMELNLGEIAAVQKGVAHAMQPAFIFVPVRHSLPTGR
jgi:hypothetical protein